MEKLPLGVFHVMIKYFFHTALSSVFSISAVCAPSVFERSSSAPNGKQQWRGLTTTWLRIQLQPALWQQSVHVSNITRKYWAARLCSLRKALVHGGWNPTFHPSLPSRVLNFLAINYGLRTSLNCALVLVKNGLQIFKELLKITNKKNKPWWLSVAHRTKVFSYLPFR